MRVTLHLEKAIWDKLGETPLPEILLDELVPKTGISDRTWREVSNASNPNKLLERHGRSSHSVSFLIAEVERVLKGPIPETPLLTTSQAEEETGRSRKTLQRYRDRKENPLPCIKFNGTCYYRKEDLKNCKKPGHKPSASSPTFDKVNVTTEAMNLIRGR